VDVRDAMQRCQGAAFGSRLRVVGLAQKAEYIWWDGRKRERCIGSELRSKTKVYPTPIPVGGEFSDWAFDGSCTSAAAAVSDSDCILRYAHSPNTVGANLIQLHQSPVHTVAL